jgi:hypothetical protein
MWQELTLFVLRRRLIFSFVSIVASSALKPRPVTGMSYWAIENRSHCSPVDVLANWYNG